MKTFNMEFKTPKLLKHFLEVHKIIQHPHILVQIFTGICDEDFITTLVDDIKALIPHVKIIGATTDGEILADTVTTQKTILSFSLFDKTHIKTFYAKKTKNCFETATNLIQQFDKDKKPRVAISFADGIDTNGEKFLDAFSEYDNKLIVAGGLAGDNAQFKKTYIFTEETILTTGAVVALLYNDDLIVHTKANFGWQSIGKTLRVTKAKDNVVYEIDGMTPVALYAKYLGDEITANLPKTGIEFPLIKKVNGLDVARAVIGKNEDGSLTFAGNVSVGDKVKFGYGNVDAIIEGGNKMFECFNQEKSESIFIYSCMARKALMGSAIATELKQLETLAPLSGFFTYGEFFTNVDALKNELLNQTMTILSLSEYNTPIKHTQIVPENIPIKHQNMTLKALSHLNAQTSQELEEINHTLEDKVRAELEKNKHKDKQLLEQSRMAQMGEMISMIAHQWRQPLGAISASSIDLKMKLAFQNFDLSQPHERAACHSYFDSQLDKIETYVQNLTQTIDDFRNFYKPNKASKVVSINDPIKKSISIIDASAKASGLIIKEDFKSQKTLAMYDSELMQVFLNIIKNAQDNFKDKEIENPNIHIHTFDTNEGIGIEIEDNGGGIEASIMKHIFDPYFSTKDEKNGTGLGLYMSKTIIEEHHAGSLSAKNKNNGVCFSIMIKETEDAI